MLLRGVMMNQKRIEDFGIKIGRMKKGPLNKISDVKGVLVGHCTIDTADHKTGCTVVIPGIDNPYIHRPACSSFVINGFGKTTGLIQIDELGELESPIVLTNTLNVGLMQDALYEYMRFKCRSAGIDLNSFNSVVAECNDSYLNRICERIVTKEHLFNAFENLTSDFAEGDIGAGKGMSCYQLKGGIGSASRLVVYDSRPFILGILVLSNHGLLKDLIVNGKKVSNVHQSTLSLDDEKDEGSIITILATDVPLNARQLNRLCKRVQNGIARTGSFTSHGSGEIVIGFSTGNLNENNDGAFQKHTTLKDCHLDILFEATTEAAEEAVLNSMICANSVMGYNGHFRESLATILHSNLI